MDTKQFLETLFPELNGGFIELRAIRTGEYPKSLFYSSIEELINDWQKIEQLANKYNIYYGVCPRNEKKGNKEVVKNIWCLWVDLDGKDFKGGKKESLEKIKSFPVPPTIIVDSGHGYHIYWKLREEFVVSTLDDIKNIEGYLKALVKVLNGDSNSAEIARVLRLPETINHKEEESLKKVTIVELNKDTQCNLSDFDFILSTPSSVEDVRVKGGCNHSGWIAEALSGMKEGNRNTTFTKIIGRLHYDGWSSNDIYALLEPKAKEVNYPDDLISQIDGICQRYPKNNKISVEDVEVVEGASKDLFPIIDFPLEVLTPKLIKFVNNISETYSIPVAPVATSVLTIISSVIGNSVRISPNEGWEVPPFLWSMIIGESGSGKTPMQNKLMTPLHKWQALESKTWKDKRGAYEVELANYQKKFKGSDALTSSDLKPEVPRLTHYKVSDITVEALAHAMENTPRGFLVYQDELSGWINGLNQYKGKGNDKQKYLELWNCHPWKIDRASANSRYIQNTGCSILGGIQPLVLPTVFMQDSINDGLLPRFLFSQIKCDPKLSGVGLSQENEAFWQGGLKSILNRYVVNQDCDGSNIHHLIHFSDSARKEHVKLANENFRKQRFLAPSERVFVPKLNEYAIRIGGILHILRKGGDEISPETLSDSFKIVDYFAGQAMGMLREYGKKSQLNEIELETVKALYKLEGAIKHGKLILSSITNAVNNNLPGLEQSPEQIVHILKRLNLNTKLIAGQSHLIWEFNKINNLFKKHLGQPLQPLQLQEVLS